MDIEPRRPYTFSDRLVEQEGSGRPPWLWKIKDEVTLTIGGILLAIGIIFAFGFIALTQDAEYENRDSAWLGIPICAGPILVPALLLIRRGIYWRRRQRELEGLAAFIKTLNQVTIEELAQACGHTQVEAMARLKECREKGLVKGVLDQSGRVFTCSSTTIYER